MDKERITLSKNDLWKTFWKWQCAAASNYNYERLQASGMLFSMGHLVKKLYPDNPKEQLAFCRRHMEFFNTEQHFGSIINGLVLAMEEEKANNPGAIDGSAISSVKTGLMGPLAGIGDTLGQGTLSPILLSVGISLAASGSPMGAIFYTVAMFSIMLGLGWFLFGIGYRQGKEGVELLLSGGKMKRLIAAASVMGAIVLGALSASYVSVSSGLVLNIGGNDFALQVDVLDQLIKGLLPLTATLGAWYLLKVKRMRTTHVLLVLTVVAGALGALGVLG